MAELPSQPFVFISYAHEDIVIATRLEADLRTYGITTWIDQMGIPIGAPDWEDAIRKAIRAASSVLVLASPDTYYSPYVKGELRIAEMYRRPIYPFWIRGEQWEDTVPMNLLRTQYVDARGARYDRAVKKIAETFYAVPAATSSPSLEKKDISVHPRNPYKGLRSFTSKDAHDFFGRDGLIHDLANDVYKIVEEKNQKGRVPLLLVIGPSGSGKSSAIMAGLLPHLRNEDGYDSKNWIYVEPVRLGEDPIEALAGEMQKLMGGEITTIREDLNDKATRGLHLLATRLIRLSGHQASKVVLFIDQFEEIFAVTVSEEKRQQFIDLLSVTLTDPGSSVIIILTLRIDFLEYCLQNPQLGPLLQQGYQRLVLPMTMKELRASIEKPAQLPDVQLTFEEDLVGDLLFEVYKQSGALPLLQFTLEQLFEKRDGHLLTFRAYQKMRGVKGALATHAESMYGKLPSGGHRNQINELFFHLTDPGMTEMDSSRRRAPLTEFIHSDPVQSKMLQETVHHFINAHLITSSTVGETSIVEFSHDALLQEWERLADWLKTKRNDRLLYKAISEATEKWQKRRKHNTTLLKGVELKEALSWKQRNTYVLNKNEDAFLRASVRQKWTSRFLRYILVSLMILSLLLLAYEGSFLPRLSVTVTNLTVTNLNDHGLGSLRSAIAAATTGDTITFAPNVRGILLLISGELQITKSIDIVGSPVSSIIVDGGHTHRLLYIGKGVMVTISNLTMRDGHAEYQGNDTANGFGGGVYNDAESTLLLENCTITGNQADFGGGGIYNSDTSKITLMKSIISNNRASIENGGGGIDNGGQLTIQDSTLFGNIAGSGGGIYSLGSQLTMTNSTITDNKADSIGGAIAIVKGRAFAAYCTIYGNTADSAGGIDITDVNRANMILLNSIIAGNKNTNPTDDRSDIIGTFLLYAYNLIQNVSGGKFVYADALSVHPPIMKSPKVGSLQNNGGGVPTLALLPGSPAIDQIPTRNITCAQMPDLSIDERGILRPQGRGCDLGAYEYFVSAP